MHKYNFKFISTEYHNIVFYKMIEYNYVYVYVQNIIKYIHCKIATKLNGQKNL